ncbi:MAG: DUF2232 domain-containing protein [Methanomicrobia archaeon]|nr:DUF2232 domain-containing protein [Methanomicrobia archaeon]
MAMLNKRETLTQNITYMAIMAGVNAIFSLIAALVPVASLFLMIVLPLSSAIVFLFCRHRYYPIYAIATIVLCLLVTLFDMSFTIFYVVPSIITGYIFGLFIKLRLHAVWIILFASVAQSLFSALSIPLVNVLFEVNLIDTFKNFLNLSSSPHVDLIIPTFLFFLSLAQIVFSYVVVYNEIGKFGYTINDQPINILTMSLIIVGVLALIIPSVFLLPSGGYLLLAISFYFMFFVIITHIINKNYKTLIAIGVFLVGFLFLFALLYSVVPNPFGLLLCGILPLLVALVSLFNRLLLILSRKDRIKSTGKEK